VLALLSFIVPVYTSIVLQNMIFVNTTT
jgi:hypothetical protein